MTVYKYFLIGIIFTLFIDLMLHVFRSNSNVNKAITNWGHAQRFWGMLLWPMTSAYFLYCLLKLVFRK